MTASTTPRLGLIQPAGSDNFVISDFDDTFSKLDGTPGVTPVANYAALPAGLTTAQHGSIYLALDTKALWMWSKPGAPAGTWVRLNSVGVISQASQASTVTTSTTTSSLAPTLVSTTFSVIGGRAVLLLFEHPRIQNDGTFGYSVCELWRDGLNVVDSVQSGGAPSKDISHVITRIVAAGTLGAPGTSVNIKVTVRSTSYGGGTTTAGALGALSVIEL
jgi:hypothetical protein